MSKVHSVLRTEDQICCYRSITSSGVRVLWEITSACNLKCDFCLVEMKRKQVSLDQALEIADALIARGVDKVLLSGGEPLVFRGVEHVMRRLVDGGVLVKLLTNGTVANEAVFQMIEADPTIEVSMSILSVRPDKADAIFRRDGAWTKLCATLDRLPPQQVNIITPVSSENYDEVEEIIDWVAARGIPGISVINVFKDPSSPARFRDDCRDYTIPQSDGGSAVRTPVGEAPCSTAGRLVIRTTQFRGCGGEECGAGKSVLYIDALGRLLPCTLTDNTVWRQRVGRPRHRRGHGHVRTGDRRPPGILVHRTPGGAAGVGRDRLTSARLDPYLRPTPFAGEALRFDLSTFRSVVTREMLQVRLRMTAQAFGVATSLVAANLTDGGTAVEVDAAGLMRPTSQVRSRIDAGPDGALVYLRRLAASRSTLDRRARAFASLVARGGSPSRRELRRLCAGIGRLPGFGSIEVLPPRDAAAHAGGLPRRCGRLAVARGAESLVDAERPGARPGTPPRRAGRHRSTSDAWRGIGAPSATCSARMWTSRPTRRSKRSTPGSRGSARAGPTALAEESRRLARSRRATAPARRRLARSSPTSWPLDRLRPGPGPGPTTKVRRRCCPMSSWPAPWPPTKT